MPPRLQAGSSPWDVAPAEACLGPPPLTPSLRLSVGHELKTLMGKDSRIKWAHRAFSPGGDASKSRWPAITATRNRGPNALAPRLGAESQRRFFSDAHWKEPLKWNRDATAEAFGAVFSAPQWQMSSRIGLT